MSHMHCLPAKSGRCAYSPRPNEEEEGWGNRYNWKSRGGSGDKEVFHVGQVHVASFMLIIPSVPDSLQHHHCSLPSSYQQCVLIVFGFCSSEKIFVHSSCLFTGVM